MRWTTFLFQSQLGTNLHPGMASVRVQRSSQGILVKIHACTKRHVEYAFCRRVIEYGLCEKHLKVEVYLLEFQLCAQPYLNDVKTREFSRADTVCE